MKYLLVFLLMSVSSTASAKLLETRCNVEDCFKYGWTTVEPGTDYLLNCQCKGESCESSGWKSEDNRGSSYSVTCEPGGCFSNGWTSIQYDNGFVFIDFVKCINGNCLKNGWDIYDNYGNRGEVTCNNGDCSSFGGMSFWRGKTSETACIANDCYKYGWTANIED